MSHYEGVILRVGTHRTMTESNRGAESAVEAARILESMGTRKNMTAVKDALCVLEREVAPVVFALEKIAKEAL
jgi:hypothetical protein